jgi:hypothetical protein
VHDAMDRWIGKVVQLWATGEDESWLGVLEGWDDRGVVLRSSEGIACFEASLGERTLSPMLMLFPWSTVRYVGVDLEEFEGNPCPLARQQDAAPSGIALSSRAPRSGTDFGA